MRLCGDSAISQYDTQKDHTNHNSVFLLGNQTRIGINTQTTKENYHKNMDDLIPDMRDLLRELRLLRKAIVQERKTNESPVRFES